MDKKWIRPADVPVPQVWARFEGPRPMQDGRIPSFWIQDVRKEDEDEIISIMKTKYLPKETMAAHLKLADDPECVAKYEALWRRFLKHQLSLALWTNYPDGQPHIVGCNLLAVSYKDDPKMEAEITLLKKVFGFVEYMRSLADIHNRYGMDKVLWCRGLTVKEEFRGMGLGLELLNARVPLGQAMGFELTATLFTSIASQKLSARAGFHQVVEIPFSEYKYNGEVVFNFTDPPTVQKNALKIPPKK